VLLSANSLSLRYNESPVVQDFSLSVAPKTMIGLIGPNGGGKTTILRALAGLIEPAAGTVTVSGKQAYRMERRVRARCIGWVPQQEIAPWMLTVIEMVHLGRAPHRGWLLPYTADDKRVVELALTRTDLLSLKYRPVNKLSGGEFQRVLIARVLAQEPQVLLLDEPTANLDIHHQVEILELVRDLIEEKELSVVMAVHDLNLAARYCDQLILLHNGRQVSAGTPEHVLTSENLSMVFGVEAQLYRDPWGYWSVSVRKKSEKRSYINV
jgi:iron complex transport system ATP-binding protein